MSILSDEYILELKNKYIDIEWFDEGEYGMEYNIYGIEDFARAIEQRVIENQALQNLMDWQQEFEKSAQIIGNKLTSYAKLKEDFE